jgi:hypothetical protein
MNAGNSNDQLAQALAPCDVEHVKKMRVAIRRMKNSLPLDGPGRYNSMNFTSLEKAAMWLGDILGCLGEVYPYKQGEAGDIADDTDETYATHNLDWDKWSPSQKLQTCRAILGQFTQQLAVWVTTPVQLPEQKGPEDARDVLVWQFKYGVALAECYKHLREARLDMGMELRAALKAEQLAHRKA